MSNGNDPKSQRPTLQINPADIAGADTNAGAVGTDPDALLPPAAQTSQTQSAKKAQASPESINLTQVPFPEHGKFVLPGFEGGQAFIKTRPFDFEKNHYKTFEVANRADSLKQTISYDDVYGGGLDDLKVAQAAEINSFFNNTTKRLTDISNDQRTGYTTRDDRKGLDTYPKTIFYNVRNDYLQRSKALTTIHNAQLDNLKNTLSERRVQDPAMINKLENNLRKKQQEQRDAFNNFYREILTEQSNIFTAQIQNLEKLRVIELEVQGDEKALTDVQRRQLYPQGPAGFSVAGSIPPEFLLPASRQSVYGHGKYKFYVNNGDFLSHTKEGALEGLHHLLASDTEASKEILEGKRAVKLIGNNVEIKRALWIECTARGIATEGGYTPTAKRDHRVGIHYYNDYQMVERRKEELARQSAHNLDDNSRALLQTTNEAENTREKLNSDPSAQHLLRANADDIRNLFDSAKKSSAQEKLKLIRQQQNLEDKRLNSLETMVQKAVQQSEILINHINTQMHHIKQGDLPAGAAEQMERSSTLSKADPNTRLEIIKLNRDYQQKDILESINTLSNMQETLESIVLCEHGRLEQYARVTERSDDATKQKQAEQVTKFEGLAAKISDLGTVINRLEAKKPELQQKSDTAPAARR